MFDKTVADSSLQPHRPYDPNILLKPDFVPTFGPLYSCRGEGASSSPAAAPILLVKKKDRKLPIRVNYRKLNEGTIKNQYPLLLVKETLERLSHDK